MRPVSHCADRLSSIRAARPGRLFTEKSHASRALPRFLTRFNRGLYQSDRSTLYVNRGFGVAGPAIRLYSPREITTLELV